MLIYMGAEYQLAPAIEYLEEFYSCHPRRYRSQYIIAAIAIGSKCIGNKYRWRGLKNLYAYKCRIGASGLVIYNHFIVNARGGFKISYNRIRFCSIRQTAAWRP